jgi:nucleoside-triphosphatase THEP1
MRSITLISGDFNSGKTTRLIEFFSKLKKGEAEGFACEKIQNQDQVTIGYRLRRLSTQDQVMFIYDKNHYKDFFREYFEYDRFIFSVNALNYVSDIIEIAIQDPFIKALFLDEIGRVELCGLGFDEVMKKMMKSDKDLYLCANERHIDAIMNKYDIKDYRNM